jgi:hypothetical protein
MYIYMHVNDPGIPDPRGKKAPDPYPQHWSKDTDPDLYHKIFSRVKNTDAAALSEAFLSGL